MQDNNLSNVVETINTTNNSNTITSLELVKLINDSRKESEAEVFHSDFLKKVPKVLGETVAGNFSSYYKASNGKENPCYKFPKREACLMAMSYSYELQAKVFDYMTELENKLSLPKTYKEALVELVKQIEISEQQQLLLEQQKPKVIYFDGLVERNLLVNFRTLAKELQMKESLLISNLIRDGFCYRTPNKTNKDGKIKIGNLKAIAKYINKDDEKSLYFEEKEWDSGKTAGTQTLITQRGRQAFLLLYKQ